MAEIHIFPKERPPLEARIDMSRFYTQQMGIHRASGLSYREAKIATYKDCLLSFVVGHYPYLLDEMERCLTDRSPDNSGGSAA